MSCSHNLPIVQNVSSKLGTVVAMTECSRIASKLCCVTRRHSESQFAQCSYFLIPALCSVSLDILTLKLGHYSVVIVFNSNSVCGFIKSHLISNQVCQSTQLRYWKQCSWHEFVTEELLTSPDPGEEKMEGLRSRAINKGLSSNIPYVCFETAPRNDLGLVYLFVHGECKKDNNFQRNPWIHLWYPIDGEILILVGHVICTLGTVHFIYVLPVHLNILYMCTCDI